MLELEKYYFCCQDIFLGKTFIPLFLAEIALRTAIMYLYTLINIRLFRTRTIAQLTSFELIIVIALGSAVGDPMFYSETPLINGMVTVTTIVLLTKLISILSERFDSFEKLIEGQPRLIIKDGEIIKAALRKSDISIEELFSRLRYRGIENTGQILYAFLETSGQISVIHAKEPKEGLSTLGHFDE